MANKRREAHAKKRVKLKKALKSSQLAPCLGALTSVELSEFAHDLGTYLYWWMSDPTEEGILALRDSLPLLEQLIDFDIVLQRVESLDCFDRSRFGVSIRDFFPELTEIHIVSVYLIHKLPQGVHKAECWLGPIAKHATGNR